MGGPHWIIVAIPLPSPKAQVVIINYNYVSLWQNSAITASFISVFDPAVNISTNLNLMRFIGNSAGSVILTPTSFFIPQYRSAHAWRVRHNSTVLGVFAWYSSNSTESREQSKPEPNMLKVLSIISKNLRIILILFSYHYLLFPYYSFALMFFAS